MRSRRYGSELWEQMERIHFPSFTSTSNVLIGLTCSVQVIVNSVCPGLVYTSIARSIVEHSRLMQLLVPLYLGGLGKSADYGARFYVTAAMAPREENVSLVFVLWCSSN
jgi:hypothetical protein